MKISHKYGLHSANARRLFHHYEPNVRDAPKVISEFVTFRVSRRQREMYIQSKKQSTIILSITSLNVDRFSKLTGRFSSEYAAKSVINYPTTP